MSQPRFIARGILLVNDPLGRGLVKKAAGGAKPLNGFFLILFLSNSLESGTERRTKGPIGLAIPLGGFHPFFTGLVVRQWYPFPELLTKSVLQYTPEESFVN
jgi:hypothetical protein